MVYILSWMFAFIGIPLISMKLGMWGMVISLSLAMYLIYRSAEWYSQVD
jgi:hypothetical protein